MHLDRSLLLGSENRYKRRERLVYPKWDLIDVKGEFHAPTKDYRWAMLQAAERAGVTEPELVLVEVPAGGCAFHHGRT